MSLAGNALPLIARAAADLSFASASLVGSITRLTTRSTVSLPSEQLSRTNILCFRSVHYVARQLDAAMQTNPSLSEFVGVYRSSSNVRSLRFFYLLPGCHTRKRRITFDRPAVQVSLYTERTPPTIGLRSLSFIRADIKTGYKCERTTNNATIS